MLSGPIWILYRSMPAPITSYFAKGIPMLPRFSFRCVTICHECKTFESGVQKWSQQFHVSNASSAVCASNAGSAP